MGGLLTRLRILAGKIESEEGVAEVLAAADAKTLAYGTKINFDPEMFKLDPARSSFTRLGYVGGKRPGNIPVSVAMKGSGVNTTEPDFMKYVKACGFGVSALMQITIGAVTSGPFQHGETITGGTSEATGRVIIATATGTTTLYFVTISGSFQSGEVITGGTSGATATTAAAESAAGKLYERISTSIPSMTLSGYEGPGIKKILKGCRGNAKFRFKSGEPGFFDGDFIGVEAGITDVTMLTGITREDTKPPAFLSASISVAGDSLKLGMVELDMQNELFARDDVDDARGLLCASIVGAEPVGDMDPEMELVATHDFFGKWLAGTLGVLDFTLGSSTGNKFRWYMPKIQYTKVEDEDKSGIAVARTKFCLTGGIDGANDEMCILSL